MLQTMIVGSLPRPTWLVPPHRMYVSWQLGEAQRAEGCDDAVVLAVADQERAGLNILAGGEQRRRHYIWGLCEGLSGLDFSRLAKIETRGNRNPGKDEGSGRRGMAGPLGAHRPGGQARKNMGYLRELFGGNPLLMGAFLGIVIAATVIFFAERGRS